MKSNERASDPETERKHQPHHVRLPGFVTESEIGLGDVIGKVTAYAGLKPCGGCAHRAAALNRWFVFSGRHSG
jgi:hypothetical protein